MEPDDFLCSRNARPPKALARANGISSRASGWTGEKTSRSRKSFAPIPERIASELRRIIEKGEWRLCAVGDQPGHSLRYRRVFMGTWTIKVRRGENRG